MDPTIFFYGGAGNNSRDLDPSDAHFVDILHTGKQQSLHINNSTNLKFISKGAGILGQWQPSGHADFYINGGN